MPPAEDPLDWTVDQVVDFLCHDPRTPWSQSTTRPPRPDPTAFEDALRTNMITGEVLLSDVDKQTLREDLGLTKIGPRSTILKAIRYLQQISNKYSHPRLQGTPPLERSASVSYPEQRRVASTDGIDRDSTHTPGPSISSPRLREIKVEEPTFSPHLRPQEHYAVDQQGRKRRKLDLNTAPQAPIDRTVSATKEDKQQVEDKEWYIGPNKVTPSELFYPIDPGSDEEDTFVMCSPSFPTAQRLFVKQRLHYFYRQQPIDLGAGDGSHQWAVVPYRQSNPENKGENHFTLYSSKGGKVAIRQENIQNWPQLSEPEADNPQDETHTLRASDPFSYLVRKYPAQEQDEEAYPLYGDSGSENGFDDETWLEMNDEKQEIAQGKQGRLSPDEVVSVIVECVNELGDKWRRDRQPKEEQKARRLWLNARKYKSVNQQIKIISRDISLLEDRLGKLQNAICEGEYSSRSELRIQCQSMEQTVFNIQSQKWRMAVLEQSECPPKVAVAPTKRSPAPKAKPGPEDGESLHSESGGESDGSADDFIVDDLGTTNVDVEDETRADSSPNKAQMPQVTEGDVEKPSQPLHSLSSDDDAVLSPSEIRLEARKRRAMLRQKETKPDPVVDTPTEDFRLRKDASPPAHKDPPPLECIDLTMDSPPPEAEDDLRIETPPLNPSIPKAPDTAEKVIKSEGRSSVSPQPNLGTTVLVEIPNKENEKRHDGEPKQSGIDFAEISRVPWDILEENKDRKKILAKLVRGLPDEERTDMTKKIPHFLWPLLRKYVNKALRSFANNQVYVRGVDESDQRLVQRAATLYISWVNCRHYVKEGILRADISKARYDTEAGFRKFHDELGRCLIAFDGWVRNESAGTGSEEPSLDGDDEQGPNTPHRKRKKEIKESQEVKRNHETAQLRVAVQDEQRKRLERRLESMGLSDSDPMHQAVSFGNPIIYLSPHIGRRIKPHQLSGIQFMWRELIEDEKRQGCVLAHTMGLGKTMQIISFLVTVSAAAASTDVNVSRQVPVCFQQSQTLVLCPSSLIENWYEEFLMWSPKDSALGPLRKITSASAVIDRLDELFAWDEEGGILIMSYDIFRTWIHNRETKARGKPLRDSEHDRVKRCLLEGPNIVVADEAHKMKNRASGIAMAASEFRSKSRIALTGSPLANNLVDYYSMVDWISPGYLGNSVEFKANYVEPIEEGLYADSSYNERRRSLMKLQVLKEILSPKVNRADISVLAGSLPPKVEFVITVSLTDLQKKAYNSYVESVFQGRGDVGNAQLWSWMAILSLCCNHPACFRDKLLSRANDAVKLSKKADEFDNTDLVPGDESVAQAGLPETVVADQEKLFAAVPDMMALGLSCRAQILDRIVMESTKAGDKVLIFSHSLPTLDYIEYLLKASGHNYCRLDGQTPIFSRQVATKRFNSAESEQVYLISTRAGGLGLNIPGANRVVIFDFSFSPVWEEQAVGRAYRLGQQKPVFVYRFLAGGTFEEVMYNKAIFKTQLAFRVVDKKNPIRWASRSLGDYLFPVKQVEQQNLSEYIGKDPHVLDKIISDDHGRTIQKIALTETFQKEDNDKLTEEEKQGVQKEIEDEQLKRTDPVAYENLIRERQLEETKRTSATMSNSGGSYYYGYEPSQHSSTYLTSTAQHDQQPRPPILTTAHTSGPSPLIPDTGVTQPTPSTSAPSVPYIPPGGPRAQDDTNQAQREPPAPVSTAPVRTSPAISSGPLPSNAPPEKPAPSPAFDGPSDGPSDTNARRVSIFKPRPENGINAATRSTRPPCTQQ